MAFHKYKMMETLGIKSNAELLQYAIRHHLERNTLAEARLLSPHCRFARSAPLYITGRHPCIQPSPIGPGTQMRVTATYLWFACQECSSLGCGDLLKVALAMSYVTAGCC